MANRATDVRIMVVDADGSRSEDVRLGAQVRLLRKARKLSIGTVAKRADVSIGLVSQIERGLSSPSLKTLRALCTALDVPIGWFFRDSGGADTQGRIVVEPENRRFLEFKGKGVTKELASPELGRALEALVVTIQPGAQSGDDYYTHEGEECGYVLQGVLELWVENQHFLIKQESSFQFESTRPHRFSNPGRVDTKVLWVIAPERAYDDPKV
jgi:transcriptional regulator with XRE-family HTH domain